MSKNKLAVFSTPQAKQRSRSKEQVASSKTNCTLFSRFYIACQARQCNLDSFFEHEYQACPLSISDMGTTATGIEIGPNGMSNKVLTTSKYSSWDRCQGRGRGCNCAYGQARSLSTFEENSQEMILPYITSQLETVSRVDIVWDKYLTNSLKQSIV